VEVMVGFLHLDRKCVANRIVILCVG
jgi:hypothetical protein